MTGSRLETIAFLTFLAATLPVACGGGDDSTVDAGDTAPVEDGSTSDALIDGEADAAADADEEADAPEEDDVAEAGDGEAETVVCELAPSCTTAGDPPPDPAHAVVLDVPAKSTDPADCDPARLRIALRSLTVHEPLDDMPGDSIYCVLQAESPGGSEIRVTTPTPNLGGGESHAYGLDQGVVWGDDPVFADADGDVLLTYDCIEVDDSVEHGALVSSLDDAAAAAGGRLVGGAWVFDGPGTTASLVSGALALLSADDPVFHAQQTIPRSQQLELTNAGWWTVRRAGTELLSDWDWELTLLVWGCVDNGI